MPFGLPWSEAFVEQISEKDVRDEYVADQVRTRIALMIRALRDQPGREWSQTDLGHKMNKPQSVVSRLESPDYGKASLQTLLEVAAAFDLPLFVDFPEWDEWARLMSDPRSSTMHKQSFDAERLMSQAKLAKSCSRSGEIHRIDLRTNSSPPLTYSDVKNSNEIQQFSVTQYG